jgi:hypothetical protein
MATLTDWLPRDPVEFAEWMTNYNTHLPGTLAAKYNITDVFLTQLERDTDWAVYWAQAKLQAKQQKKQVEDYYDTITGEPEAPQPAEPTFALPANKPASVPPGMRKRIRDSRSQIVGMKSVYTEADGELLGIVGTTAGRTPNPTFDFLADTRPNFTVRVAFLKFGYTAARFEYQYKGENVWHFADKLTNSPGDLQIPPRTPNTAEQVLVRGILMDKNETVGQYSDIKTCLIAP